MGRYDVDVFHSPGGARVGSRTSVNVVAGAADGDAPPHSTTLALALGAPGATVMDAPSFRAATHPLSPSHDVPSEDFGQISATTAYAPATSVRSLKVTRPPCVHSDETDDWSAATLPLRTRPKMMGRQKIREVEIDWARSVSTNQNAAFPSDCLP